ncbi:hypothetical protein OAT29_01945 [Flavobacteriaceae bacterium]|nr:hypothetical protein [Flavobacteriaceae bacterium]
MSKMQKKDVKIFNDLVDKFRAIYFLENHKDFKYVDNMPQEDDPSIDYMVHTVFNSTLILIMILLKKYNPKHPFFYPETVEHSIYDYQLNNWLNVKKAFGLNSNMNKHLQFIDKELKNLRKEQIKKTNIFSENPQINNDKNHENFEKLNELIQIKSDLEKKISNTETFLDLQKTGFSKMIKNNFPFIVSQSFFYSDSIYYAWLYLDDCFVLSDSIIKYECMQDYIINLCNSIPQKILDVSFIELVKKITTGEHVNESKIESLNFLNLVSRNYNPKSICTINPELLSIFEDTDISIMPSYDYKYENINEQHLHNVHYLKNLVTGKNKFKGLTDYLSKKNNNEYDLFVGSLFKQINDKKHFDKYIEAVYNILNKNGIAILLVNKDDNNNLSEKISELNFAVESIISLQNFSCVILNKGNKVQKFVNIFDGYDFVKQENGETKFLFRELLNKFYSKDKFYFKQISYKKFSSNINDKSFDIARYFMPDFTGKELSKFLTPFKGEKKYDDSSGLLVKIADLNNELFNSQFEKKLEIKSIPKSFLKIDFSCMLFATKGTNLKPTYFEFKENPIFISNNILSLKINDKLIPDFLKLQLGSPKAKKQLAFIKSGNVIPFFKEKDILNKIKIDVPDDIEEQKTIIFSQFNRYLDSIRSKFSSSEIENKKIYSEVFDDIDHRIGGYLLAINLASKHIKKYTSELDNFEGFIKPKLEKITNNISNINRLIQSYTTKIYNNKIISCHDVIKSVEKEFNGLQLSYLIIESNFDRFTKEYKQNGINVSIEPLKQLIHEIIKNAQKYGGDFSNKLIIINLSLSENNFIMSIKNNGLPMDSEMDKDLFIQKGSTTNKLTGGGNGGHVINQIAKDFETCSWELINDSQLDYPVEFIFKFELEQLE